MVFAHIVNFLSWLEQIRLVGFWYRFFVVNLRLTLHVAFISVVLHLLQPAFPRYGLGNLIIAF